MRKRKNERGRAREKQTKRENRCLTTICDRKILKICLKRHNALGNWKNREM